MLGSQAMAGATDHNLFLSVRKDETRVFESQARVGLAFPQTRLVFNPETHELSIEGTVKALRQDVLHQELLTALGEKMLTMSDWRSRVRGRNADKSLAIRELEAQGRIEKLGEGRTVLWRQRKELYEGVQSLGNPLLPALSPTVGLAAGRVAVKADREA